MEQTKVKWYQNTWFIVLCLIFFFPAGIYLVWKHKKWNQSTKIISTVLSVFLFLVVACQFSSSSETQNTIPVSSIKIPNQAITLDIQESKSIPISYTTGSDPSELEFISENETIHFEKDLSRSTNTTLYGKITGISEGTANFYVKSKNSNCKSFSVCVTVIDKQKQQIALAQKQAEQERIQKEEQAKAVAKQKEESEKAAKEKQKTTQTSNTKKKETTSTTKDTSQSVYYTRTGECYHYKNPCGNGNYYPCSLTQAKAKGLRPCKKCVL